MKLRVFAVLFILKFAMYNAIAQSVFINEIHYDNSGSDVDEAIEIAGTAGTNLTNWSVALYNGSNGSVYNTITLSETIPNQQNGYGTVIKTLPSNGLQNGAPDGIALIDNNDSVIQFISYEGVVTATNGPATGQSSTDIGVSESSSTAIGFSLQLSGTGTVAEDFTWESPSQNTYGNINTNQNFEVATIIPVINEFVINHTGSDTDEFVEILAGTETDLSNYWLLEIDGDSNASGVIDEVVQLGTTDANGYFTAIAQENSYENGTLALFLVTNFTGTLGQDLDTNNDGILDIIPWQEQIDAIGVNDGDDQDLNYATVTLAQSFDGIRFTVGGASRFPNGINTDGTSDWTRNDFAGAGLPSFPDVVAQAGEAINTPGQENSIVEDTSTPDSPIIINEIDADTQGSDQLEFVELYDGGVGNTTLNGLVLVNYNGNNNLSYNTFDLEGFRTNAQGYFVIGNASVTNVDLIVPANSFQNGADAVALYFDEATRFPNGTTITTENIIDAVVYGTNDADDAELLTLLNTNQPQINESANDNKDFESLQRTPNGEGGARNTISFEAKEPTPGRSNDGIIIVPTTPISIAQARAVEEGAAVTVSGVITVTDSFNGPAFIQDQTGGIAVFDRQVFANPNLKVGDSITVTGARVSFNDQIQIGSVVEVIDNGLPKNPIVPLEITLSQIANHPGELIRILNPSFPNPGDLLFANTNFTLTDTSGRGDLRVNINVDTIVGKTQPLNCPEVTGVVGRFREFFQILPRNLADIPCATEFIPPSDTIGIAKKDTFDVVAWNIEWFGDENNSPVGQNPMSDAIQRDSTATVLQRLDADIYAVSEIADDALFGELVAQLPGYDYILSDAFSNPDAAPPVQKVGFIYNTTTVSIVKTRAMFTSIHPLYNGGDASAIVDYPSEPSRFFASGRLPFLLTADVTINGVTEQIELIALHARANRGTDAQNRYDMRKYDAEVLKDSLDLNFANSKVILLGDYNDDVDQTVADVSTTESSFQEYVNDSTNYTIVTAALSEAGLRSFVSRENMIDHITITNELNDTYVDRSVTVHYEVYDRDYQFTTSDHFPVSARFLLEKPFVANDCLGRSVVSFRQGRRADGRRISRFRSQKKRALGYPNERRFFDFVSLGFGGSITIELTNEIFDNKDTNEFAVVESTGFFGNIPCNYFPETAEVFASKDGVNFTSLGSTCQDGEFDLASGNLSSAKYIKIVDTSDRRIFPWFSDGFDLDAIVCLENGKNKYAKQTPLLKTLPTAYESELMEEGMGIEETEITLSPNPVKNKLFLALHIPLTDTIDIAILDVNGKKIFEESTTLKINQSSITVDMSSFPNGFYLVKVTNPSGGLQYHKKVIKN